MKKIYCPIALIALCMAASCSDDDTLDNVSPSSDGNKEPIAFTASAVTGSASSGSDTRAGFTGGTEFSGISGKDTEIVARFSSKKTGGTSSDIRHTRTVLKATADATAQLGANWQTYSNVEYVTGYDRYWDDAYGRSAQISVYAVAVPNHDAAITNGTTSTKLLNLVKEGNTQVSATNTNWKSDTEDNTIDWQVSTTQTNGWDKTIGKEDLCYSHNIQDTQDESTALKYGKGKNGVRTYGAHSDITAAGATDGYPNYYYVENPTDGDHYPTLDDKTLQFRLSSASQTDGPGKFDRGHMIFHHALTRITIHLKRDLGYSNDVEATEGVEEKKYFVLSNPIALLKMPYKGTLNYQTGIWSSTSTADKILMAEKDPETINSNKMDYTQCAQVLPGFILHENKTDNVVSFTTSDNTYYITERQLFNALNTTDNTSEDADKLDINGNKKVTVNGETEGSRTITLEQGKNYVFTITVQKTKIQAITASLVPWVNVTAEHTATNSYVDINVKEATGTYCTNFDLYRMNDDMTDIYAPTTGVGTGTDWTPNKNWEGTAGTEASQNYYEKATLSSTSTDNVWQTNWFWESNKSFYHFRTVDKGIAIQDNTTTDADNIKIFSGPINDTWAENSISTKVNDKKYNDYHWGAPYTKEASGSTFSLTYDVSKGYADYIYPAIGSTTETINILEQHMMANIHIILKTNVEANTTTGIMEPANGGVDLRDATNKTTQVTLTKFIGEGKVNMGNGLVTPTGSAISSDIPSPGIDATYTYGTNNTLLLTVASAGDYFKSATDYGETKSYDYRVVPQKLSREKTTGEGASAVTTTEYVGLTIITPDNNQYYVVEDLSKIKAKSVTNNTYNKGNQAENSAIEYWYPGYDYTYTITINKTGIQAITCSVVDWVKVEAENIELDLEK